MRPTDPSAQLASAFELLKSGRLPAAEALCRQLAAALPRDPRPQALLARVLNLSGRAPEARAAVDSALAIDPGFVPALIEDAQLARAGKDPARAVAALEKLIAAQPGNFGAVYDLGVSLLELGRIDHAEREFNRVIGLVPGFADARFKLGHIAVARGDSNAALEHYAACCQLRPNWIEAWINRGLVLRNLERPGDAAQAYSRALALAPDHTDALEGYARAQRDAGGDMREIINACRRLTEIDPHSAAAWFRLANAYRAADLYPEHAQACDRAIEIDPNFLPAQWERFQEPQELVLDAAGEQVFLQRWRQGLEHFEGVDFRAAEHEATLGSEVGPRTNFHLHYLGQPFVDLQVRYAKMAQRLAQAIVPDLTTAARTTSNPVRIRVGFVSAFMRRHTVSKLFGSLIEGLPRERFEITVIHLEDRLDEVSARLRDAADHFLSGNLGARGWAKAIAERELDALVYLDIGMHQVPQVLAAFRLAPLQCMLWGHPVTTGFTHIDFFLSSDAMEPEGAQSHYTERLVRLPRLGTCYAIPDKQPDASLEIPARRDADAVHYFLGQTIFKLGHVHDDALARIAEQLPQARFSLLPHPRPHIREQLAQRMRRAFEARGLDLDRHVHMFPYLTEAQFMAVAAASDVNLDSIGWSGGNTTLEITWLDVPTVSLPGELMRSRHTSAILRLMGLDELVARDLDDYVRIAVELGRDPHRRSALRAQIAQRKHALYNDRGVVDAFAAFLERETGLRTP